MVSQVDKDFEDLASAFDTLNSDGLFLISVSLQISLVLCMCVGLNNDFTPPA